MVGRLRSEPYFAEQGKLMVTQLCRCQHKGAGR